MSRLDSAIKRLTAQRACLDLAAELVRDRPGPALELGLGNGRTYDHMREHLAGREIFVFDRRVAAHPDCVPDPAHMFLGSFEATLPTAAERIGTQAVLVHADIGTGDETASRAVAAVIAPLIDVLVAPGAIVLADQEMRVARWRPLALPPGVEPVRYFLYQVRDG